MFALGYPTDKDVELQRRQLDRNDPNLVVVHIRDISTPDVRVFCYTDKKTFGKQLNKFPASRWTGRMETSPSEFKGKIFTFTSVRRDCFSSDDIEYFKLTFGKCIRATAMCLGSDN